MSYALFNTVIILIHGTWAVNQPWHKPEQGPFFDILSQQAQKRGSIVVPFCWTGNNTHEDRLTAAHSLVRLITSYEPTKKLYIIGHSHGGNVALIASELLFKKQSAHIIDSVYLLGTPVHDRYKPNMNHITHLYNLISFKDFIQPVLGIFKREQPKHPRCAQMSISIDGKEPDHSNMHHYAVALWLLDLDRFMHTHEATFEQYVCTQPGHINFYTYQYPTYQINTEWDTTIAFDQKLQERIIPTLLRSHQHLQWSDPELFPLLPHDQAIH